jgi:hypothetical protein
MDNKLIKIFSVAGLPRLNYISEIILRDILGLSYEIVTDRRKLGKNYVINYSDENIQGALKIEPDPMMLETGISAREIKVGEWNGLPVLFPGKSEAAFPFDIFAASFFMLSRYEEYLDFRPDRYGRFPATESTAYKHGFLDLPVDNLWVMEFAKTLLRKFRTIAFRKNEFRSVVTFDLDEPFAYRGKNILYSFGGMLRDLGNDVEIAAMRYRSVVRGEKDPYEVFDYITERTESSSSPLKFFFPMGDRSEYDRNPSWKSPDYRRLISSISAKYEAGLHPSFRVSDNQGLLGAEAERFHKIIGRKASSVRFHFIRIRFPDSYRDLIKEGITEDYSMGFPDEPGFRAGMAMPFTFYDIREERRTNLRVFPFQVMDGTLFQYKGYDALIANEVVRRLIDQTRKVGGLFISIWHNTSLLEDQKSKYKRDVFESMLKHQMQ